MKDIEPPFIIPEMSQEEQDEIQEGWESLESALEDLTPKRGAIR